MGCRATDGRVCLSHGFFHAKHPRLQSAALVPRLHPEPEGLRHCLEGWDFSSPSNETDAKSPNPALSSRTRVTLQQSEDRQNSDGNGYGSKSKAKANSNRRWVVVQTSSAVSETLRGG